VYTHSYLLLFWNVLVYFILVTRMFFLTFTYY